MGSKPIFAKHGPIMFAQVREDAAVEIEMLRRIGNKGKRRAMVIASGGCTAFSILGEENVEVDAIDISRAQVALVELKARLFTTEGFEETRRACCEDAREAYDRIRGQLGDDTRDALDPFRDAMHFGLNNCGQVDQQLRNLASLFFMGVHSRGETEEFLSLADLPTQQKFWAERWNTWQWRWAIAVAFNRNFLSAARFKNAMKLVPDNFADAMRDRFQRALTVFPNATNPYLWQAFFNRYAGTEEGFPLYLQKDRGSVMLKNLRGGLRLLCGDVLEHLQDAESQQRYDFIALSNVLELLPPDYAQKLIPALLNALKPKGLVLTRSIFPRFSNHFFPGQGLTFAPDLSELAESLDRSLFCNFIEVYRGA